MELEFKLTDLIERLESALRGVDEDLGDVPNPPATAYASALGGLEATIRYDILVPIKAERDMLRQRREAWERENDDEAFAV